MAEKKYVSDNAQLMAEWDYKQNSSIGFFPEETPLSSKQKVNWLCEKGHKWSASIASRYYKSAGCPICARATRAQSRRLSNINKKGALLDLYPEIAAEWHPTKNGDLTPDKFSAKSNAKVWWKCNQCGKEWQTSIGNRANGTGCPTCAKHEGGKKHTKFVIQSKGSLNDKYPFLALEWHIEKNAPLLPQEVASGSAKKVWWKCSKCGYEWLMAINKRTSRGSGCPNCRNEMFAKKYRSGLVKKNGSLIDNHPEIASEWNYEKNGNLLPEEMTSTSGAQIWWKCSFGHEWQSSIDSRIRYKTGCPFCSGRLAITGENDLLTTHPEIAAEWHPTKNGDLKPSDFKIGSDKIVWWKCIRGHEWKTNIYHRQETGCPECIKEKFTSFPEQAILFYVGKSFPNVKNRYMLDNSIEIDIYIPEFSIAIEYDGAIFHNTKAGLDRDLRKYIYLRERGICLIRVRESIDRMFSENIADVYLGYDDNKNNRNLEKILYDLSAELTHRCKRDISWDIDISRDRRKIFKQYMDLEKANSIAVLYPHTLDEWDYEKNAPVTPYMVTKGSEKPFWWKCSKGHEIESRVKDRVRHGCPYCSNNKVLTGFNDLSTTHPHLAREWIVERNNMIKPTEIIGGKQIVWWRCSKGHEWQASIDSRKQGNGCPVCAGKQVLAGYNDLATINPDLASEWNYEKNNGLLPSDVVPGSNKKAWWKCHKHGHEWEAVINSRVQGKGCPYCANQKVWTGFNDLASKNPMLADEWHPTKNDRLLPTDVTISSGKKVWWLCRECAHEWEAVIGSRSKGAGCPECAKQKRKKKDT